MPFAASLAAIAQLGERQTEDLEVSGSIPGLGIENFYPLVWHGFSLCNITSSGRSEN